MTQEKPNDQPQPSEQQPPKETSETKSPKPKRKKSKGTPWERALSRLPADVRERLQSSEAENDSLTPEELEYQQVRAKLPAPVQEAIDATTGAAEVEDDADAPDLRWVICEQPEGEFPKIRMFETAEALVRHLGELDGTETAVWPLYGIPLRFTLAYGKTKDRYLFLPGEQTALRIPKSAREAVERIDADLLSSMEWQDDGWMGDPALAESVSEEYYTGSKLKQAEEDDEFPDDDFDEDDDGGENSTP
jgi:hypothetical protein